MSATSSHSLHPCHSIGREWHAALLQQSSACTAVCLSQASRLRASAEEGWGREGEVGFHFEPTSGSLSGLFIVLLDAANLAGCQPAESSAEQCRALQCVASLSGCHAARLGRSDEMRCSAMRCAASIHARQVCGLTCSFAESL